jgi:H+/Cl- antiporter ClcA
LFLLVGVAGGFGAVFGVPIAGAEFALEVSRRVRAAPLFGTKWKERGSEFLLCLFVSFASDFGARLLGTTHALHGEIAFADLLHWQTVAALILTACACGLLAWIFLFTLHHFKIFWAKLVPLNAWRPAAGGLLFGLLLFVFGTYLERYSSLGIGPIQQALLGDARLYDPFAKLAATVFSIGVGFKGGEVTPLFFIGATAGGFFASLLGGAPIASAGVGLVACFAAAADVPIASAAMAGELFGVSGFVIALPVCFLASWICRHSRLYDEKPEL